MAGTTFGIVMIVIAAVIGLVFMLVLVLAAAERPYFRHPRPDRMWSNVRGGVHLGDPRSQEAPEEEQVRSWREGGGQAPEAARDGGPGAAGSGAPGPATPQAPAPGSANPGGQAPQAPAPGSANPGGRAPRAGPDPGAHQP